MEAGFSSDSDGTKWNINPASPALRPEANLHTTLKSLK